MPIELEPDILAVGSTAVLVMELGVDDLRYVVFRTRQRLLHHRIHIVLFDLHISLRIVCARPIEEGLLR